MFRPITDRMSLPNLSSLSISLHPNDIAAESVLMATSYSPFIQIRYHHAIMHHLKLTREIVETTEDSSGTRQAKRPRVADPVVVRGEATEMEVVEERRELTYPELVKMTDQKAYTDKFKDKSNPTEAEIRAWLVENPQYNDIYTSFIPLRDGGYTYTGYINAGERGSPLSFFLLDNELKGGWGYMKKCFGDVPTHAWFVDPERPRSPEPIRETATGTNRRRAPDTPTPEVTPDKKPFRNPMSLLQEYKTHCLWLRMQNVPCTFHDDAIEDVNNSINIDNAGPKIRMLKGDESLSLFDIEPDAKLTVGGQGTSRWDDFVQFTAEMLLEEVDVWNSKPNEGLSHFKFDHLGDSHYGPGGPRTVRINSYISWLRWHMATKSGTLYGGRAPQTDTDLQRVIEPPPSNSNYDELRMYSVEHVNPQSWCGQCQLINEFRYAVSDPTTCFMTLTSNNQQRNNAPLIFSRNSRVDKGWRPWTASNSMAPCAARAVIHATLTYPLLTNRMGITAGSAGSYGIHEYAVQLDDIITLATKEPLDWEVEAALQCYVRFGCVNPLVVSKNSRDELKHPNSPFRRLLKARWKGVDEIAKLMSSIINDVVEQQ